MAAPSGALFVPPAGGYGMGTASTAGFGGPLVHDPNAAKLRRDSGSVAGSERSRASKRSSKSTRDHRGPKNPEADDLVASLKLEMPVDRDASTKWHASAKDWMDHIERLENEIHSMREIQFEFKKKQVKQAMMKMRWGDSALRQTCFTSWKEGASKWRAERIIETEHRTRQRFETEIAALKYRVEDLEKENSRFKNSEQELEQRIMASELERRKMQKKLDMHDAQVEYVERQLRAAKKVVAAVRGDHVQELLRNLDREYSEAKADYERAEAQQAAKRQQQRPPGPLHAYGHSSPAPAPVVPGAAAPGPYAAAPSRQEAFPSALPGPAGSLGDAGDGEPGVGYGVLGMLGRGFLGDFPAGAQPQMVQLPAPELFPGGGGPPPFVQPPPLSSYPGSLPA